MERNGYQVVAYRKFGDAGRQFNGHTGGWANFAIEDSPKPLEIWVPRFGPATPKSAIFGQPKDLGPPFSWFWRSLEKSSVAAQGRAMSVSDLRGMVDCSISNAGASLNFSSQAELLKMLFRVVFEEELGAAKNLWTAGLSRDGLRKAARAFPSQGSLICDEFLRNVPEKLPASEVVTRHEALKVMNRSLRHCPDFALGQTSALRQAASQTQAAFCLGLAEPRSGECDFFGDDQCFRFRRRLAERVDTYNVFTQPLGNGSTASQPRSGSRASHSLPAAAAASWGLWVCHLGSESRSYQRMKDSPQSWALSKARAANRS
eukprot:s3583_g3.t1